ncbi:MAG: redoxin domain-containing protein [Patescibacteria group bacterium]|nr:redoxin domain-containing protein [Patescibacteria group bacterium]
MDTGTLVELEAPAPAFTAKAFHNGEIKDINLTDYHGKWVVLFFYPADFTFVCPTELTDLAAHYDRFKELGVEVIGVSTDTEWSHKVWHETSAAIGKVQYPLVADPSTAICRAYGTLIEEEGLAHRGRFIIDPDGTVQGIEMTAGGLGRNVEEVIRQIEALQHMRKNPNQVCPMSFSSNGETLIPGVDLAGKI